MNSKLLAYEEFVYNVQVDKDNQLDIFYLFFGIFRNILWEISPEIKIIMIQG